MSQAPLSIATCTSFAAAATSAGIGYVAALKPSRRRAATRVLLLLVALAWAPSVYLVARAVLQV